MNTQSTSPDNRRIQERIRQLREKIYLRKNGHEPKTVHHEFVVKYYEHCTMWVRVR